MKTQTLTFTGSQGHDLVARLDTPDDANTITGYALFAHCFTCNKNLRAVSNINKALTERGIAVLRFDFTGLGESEGDFADTNFSSNIDDLVAAAEFMGEIAQPPQLLVGHSLGGAAVLQAAKRIPSCRAVATIGAPYEPTHVTHLLACELEHIERTGIADVILAGRKFTIKKQFLDDLEENRMNLTLRDLKRALLVLHAPLDNTVGINNAGSIFQAARHPKSFIALDGADHLLTKGKYSKYAGGLIATWAAHYI